MKGSLYKSRFREKRCWWKQACSVAFKLQPTFGEQRFGDVVILGCEPLGGRLLGVQSLKGLVTCTLVIWGCSFWLVEVCVGVFVQLVGGGVVGRGRFTLDRQWKLCKPVACSNRSLCQHGHCLLGWHQRAFQVGPRITLTSPLFHS